MKYHDIFNTTLEAIESRQWNPYLGISINNKAFTPENIAAFTRWGIEHCNTRFALLIVDVLQRINNEVFGKMKIEKAVNKAFQQADVILESCRDAVEKLPADQRERVVILEWPDIVDSVYTHNTRLVFDLFENNATFKNYILASVTNNLGNIVTRLNQDQLHTICGYVLYEVSEFLCGFVHQGVHYNLCVYPGSITALTRDLLRQDCFQAAYAQFHNYGPVAHAELYI
ncbi:MAG: tRNA-dependent cyclodipeptide synthase [Pseudomonadota bacterium]